ncbi:major facilitator superfamily domain-containing protein 6 [Nematostella vectensis]|uniref:major facilitator superfamily domain-containing protein 6 n=1 Tax=Nematostella vectensis TaxID=45351 RepID=UPI00138FA47C|nr:major facilitator superfamily domain-containing protein 6 [Nematostella vectensis]
MREDKFCGVMDQDENSAKRPKLVRCEKVGWLNKKLLVSKLFYFCYWGAVGSFFPLLGVYFKQLGMNPYLSGILVGCRPMVEFFSAPILGSLADRLDKRKVLMIFSLMCWVSFTFSLAFIKPAPVTCRKYFVLTKNVSQITSGETSEVKKFLQPATPKEKEPKFNAKSSLVYDPDGVHQVFLVLLFLTIIGEFFSAPAITLADSATLGVLGENKELYGRQRLWGSLGWGTAMFLLGFVIDRLQGVEMCGEIISQNYTVGFYFFVVFMSCALLVATRFSFKGSSDSSSSERQGRGFDLFKILFSIRYSGFLIVVFFMGFGIGLIFTFLFWHLEDLGGPPTLFGIASLIDHLSEIICYFHVGRLINSIGHIPVLYIGLAGNFVRFLYISWIQNPWLVLPLEVLQGLTHAAVWASCTSYMGRIAPPGYSTSAQGILQGVHHGLGRGCGAIVGGVMIHHFGTNKTFSLYGIACLVVLVIFGLQQKVLGPDEQITKRPNTLEVSATKAKNSPTGIVPDSSPPSVLGPIVPALFAKRGDDVEPKFRVVGQHVQPQQKQTTS